MRLTPSLLLIVLLLLSGMTYSQKVTYAVPDRNTPRHAAFEVIGKVGSNYLVYTQVNNRGYITAYDNDMKVIAKTAQSQLPGQRLLSTHFLTYPDHAWMICQYSRFNLVYCQAAKIDALGKTKGEPITLDTTHISSNGGKDIYSPIISEDQTKIVLHKTNTNTGHKFRLTVLLFSEELLLLERSVLSIAKGGMADEISAFGVDNDGDFVFAKYNKGYTDTVGSASLFWKPAGVDSLKIVPLQSGRHYHAGKPIIKIDNGRKSFYYAADFKLGPFTNINQFQLFVWNKVLQREDLSLSWLPLQPPPSNGMMNTPRIRFVADMIVRDVIFRKDGGFVIGAETYAVYFSPGVEYRPYNAAEASGAFPTSVLHANEDSRRTVRRIAPSKRNTIHMAGDITFMSFSEEGKAEWTSLVPKRQQEAPTGNFISYGLVNAGDNMQILFNTELRRGQRLTNYTLPADGTLMSNPSLKGIDEGYELLPRLGKQVSARSVIMPCYHRKGLAFAKLDF